MRSYIGLLLFSSNFAAAWGFRPQLRLLRARGKQSVGRPSQPTTSLCASVPGDLAKLTIPKLKDILKEKGLKVSGSKAELVERLRVEEDGKGPQPPALKQNVDAEARPLIPKTIMEENEGVDISVKDVERMFLASGGKGSGGNPALSSKKSESGGLLSDDDLLRPEGDTSYDARASQFNGVARAPVSTQPSNSRPPVTTQPRNSRPPVTTQPRNSRPPVFTRPAPSGSLSGDARTEISSGGGEDSSEGGGVEEEGADESGMVAEFGPSGHDYCQRVLGGAPEGCPNEADVDSLLSARLECKLSCRFQEADAVQEELRAMGIEVNDKTKEWQFGPGGTHEADFFTADVATYEYTFLEPDFEHSVDVEAAKALVVRRNEFKKHKQFDDADAARNELESLGVVLNDKGRVFAVMHPTAHHPYTLQRPQSGSSEAAESRAAVDALLGAIWHAKRTRDFDAADAARDELDGYGVVYSDDELTWAVR